MFSKMPQEIIFKGFIHFCLFFGVTIVFSQDPFEGTFMTQNQAVTMQLKPVGDAYHGTLQSTEGIFPLKALREDMEMSGTVYTTTGNYHFSASAFNGGLQVVSEGYTYQFFQISYAHQLDGVDLTQFFPNEDANPNPGTDVKNIPNPNAGDSDLFNFIAGSQLVFYQRTSYLIDSRASTLTYVNFCPDGRFNLNYDGSFSVEGDYWGNAHGVTRGSDYGTWQLNGDQGNIQITLTFTNGETRAYPVNRAHVKAGRWRIGNTQYALARNKAVCK